MNKKIEEERNDCVYSSTLLSWFFKMNDKFHIKLRKKY